MAEPRSVSFSGRSDSLSGRAGSFSSRVGSFPDDSSLTQLPTTLVNARVCPSCGGRYPADFKVCPHDATRLEDASPDGEDPLLGQQLGGTYEILRVIGEGGMGRVYEARHTRLARKRFAVKVLHHELARQPEVVTRFQREAEAASALAHPNVVSVFDVNVASDGRPYLVAELLEGEQLGDYLDRRQRLPVDEAVRIVRQVCRALSVAHENGIVHRDMKPENVFLSGGAETVKVLDFGISKLAETGENLTKTGMVMGTPDYMAPEQARGDRVDARADVYAVGAILYRALTGRKPFEALDAMATLTAVLVQEPERPSALNPALPLELEMVVQRAMAKSPADRYPNMAALDEALAPFDADAVTPPAESGEQAIVGKAKTLFATPDWRKSQASIERDAEAPRLARPRLMVFSAIGFLWLVGNVIVAVGAVLRLSGAADLTETESILVPLGVIAAIVTPAIVWGRHLAREVWPNTPRAVELAGQLKRTVLYSACAYGFFALAIQFIEAIVNRSGGGVARPVWALGAFQVAATVAALTWLAITAKRRASVDSGQRAR